MSEFERIYGNKEFIQLIYRRDLNNREQQKTGYKREVVILNMVNKGYENKTIPAFFVWKVTK